MCDECRWNQHGQCRGRLGGKGGYRCLCRLCVPAFRRVPERAEAAQAVGDDVVASPSVGAQGPALRLVWSHGTRVDH